MSEYTERLNRAGIPVWRPAQPVIDKEDEHQTALTNWARMMRTQYPALTLYHHIPNGGKRGKREAAIFKAMGVKAGVPDLFLPCAREGYHGLYVEMKALDGRPSKAQLEMLKALSGQGYRCVVCHGADEARRVIEDYLRGGAI